MSRSGFPAYHLSKHDSNCCWPTMLRPKIWLLVWHGDVLHLTENQFYYSAARRHSQNLLKTEDIAWGQPQFDLCNCQTRENVRSKGVNILLAHADRDRWISNVVARPFDAYASTRNAALPSSRNHLLFYSELVEEDSCTSSARILNVESDGAWKYLVVVVYQFPVLVDFHSYPITRFSIHIQLESSEIVW